MKVPRWLRWHSNAWASSGSARHGAGCSRRTRGPQADAHEKGGGVRGMAVTIRTSGDPLDLSPAVRRVIESLDPELPSPTFSRCSPSLAPRSAVRASRWPSWS
jgi:hypothetical protein